MLDKYNFLPIRDAVGTHRKFLLKALQCTTGPVLELGMGLESTPYLHAYCEGEKRFLHSLDHHIIWASKFTHLRTDQHQVDCIAGLEDIQAQEYAHDMGLFVDDANYVKLYDDPRVQEVFDSQERWGVVLIDHIGERRKEEVKRLMHKVDIFVLHDTESDESVHNWGELWPLVKYRVDDLSMYPNTTALSQTVDVQKVFSSVLL